MTHAEANLATTRDGLLREIEVLAREAEKCRMLAILKETEIELLMLKLEKLS